MTKEKVAIKILQKSKIIDVADVERVSREIHILKLIRHPNIIQLYEVIHMQIIETPTKLYLIMEYASSGELFDYIVSKSRIKEQEACKIFQQVIAGVEYIHKLNIVHRDLKPENLLLDHENRIKIVDFGLSNTYNDKELLKTACGSPCYAAPEMIAGKKYIGLKADIWSTGVILFAMICGYLPFEDPNTRKLYKKILKGVYQAPTMISENAKDLIEKILKTDPDQRYSIEDIKKHPWFTQTEQHISPGILIGYQNISVDNTILERLSQYKVDIAHTKKCIEANKHNSLSTAYYLLLKKHIKDGGRVVESSQESVKLTGPKQFNLNQSQELIPLYRLSQENLFTPGPKKLFEFTKSPKHSVTPKISQIVTHSRNRSQIVERNQSPQAKIYMTEPRHYGISQRVYMNRRPPARENSRLVRINNGNILHNSIDQKKDSFLKPRFNGKNRSVTAAEEKSTIKAIKVKRDSGLVL